MPQEFYVIRCFSCETFQVHIVKKSNKWCCKMCGEKQSLKKVYYQGSSKDCRVHVQSLNEKRLISEINTTETEECQFNDSYTEEIENVCNISDNVEQKESKWNDYLKNEEQLSEIDTDDSRYTFERPNKRKFAREKGQVSNNKKQKINKSEDVEIDLDNDYNKSVNFKSNAEIDKNLKKRECQKKSKWEMFTTENDHSTNNSQADSDTKNIFNNTDISTLDSILDL